MVEYRPMKRILAFAAAAVLACAGFAVRAEPTRAEKLRAKLDSNDRGYVFVTMHRGDWRHAPENSSAAILGSIAMGADIVELDVAPTKDGHYVLLHDGSLDRVSTGKGKAGDLTLAEIKRHRLKDERTGAPTEYEILTLEEAFALTRGKILVNLDKYPRDPKGITELAIRLGVAREIVFKSGLPKEELRAALGDGLWAKFASKELFYMPILRDDAPGAARIVKDWGGVPGAFELCFKDEKELSALKLLGSMPVPGPRIWINTLWQDLCATHTDERGHAGDPEGSWGWCIRQGATMIQTDRPEDLIRYLDSLGRHTLDSTRIKEK